MGGVPPFSPRQYQTFPLLALLLLWVVGEPVGGFVPSPPCHRRKPSFLASTVDINQSAETPGGVEDEDETAFNNLRQQQWDDQIAGLLEYNQTFGTVNVPYTHANNGDEYAGLASFANNVRHFQGRLSKERYAQLTAMGFTWVGAAQEKFDQQWEEMFQRLVDYKRVHGNCNVPYRWDEEEPNSLGYWVKDQRSHKKMGLLSAERTTKLNSIGFVWKLRNGGRNNRPDLEAAWEGRRQELIQYHKENGHYWVPIDRKDKNNKLNPLGYWVKRQRELYSQGNLRLDREALLNEIGFPWDSKSKRDQQWEAKFKQLQGILQEQGTADDKLFTPKVLGIQLYEWLRCQRRLHAKGTLKPQRKKMLENLGFQWI